MYLITLISSVSKPLAHTGELKYDTLLLQMTRRFNISCFRLSRKIETEDYPPLLHLLAVLELILKHGFIQGAENYDEKK